MSMSEEPTRSARRRFLHGSLALVSLSVLSACGLSIAGTSSRARVPRLGILGNFPSSGWDALREGLAELGYADGQSIVFEVRWSDGFNDRFPALAAELVALDVDVVAVSSIAGLVAARDQTRTIPIISIGAFTDPVATGFAATLSRPGGTITGLTGEPPEISQKRLELLRETVPTITRVALLENVANSTLFVRTNAAGQKLGIHVQTLPLVASPGDLDKAFEVAVQTRPDALVVDRAPLFVLQRTRILDFVKREKLPSIFGLRQFADDGALLYYATNLDSVFRRAAHFVDMILRGGALATSLVSTPPSSISAST
jgi:putative tryptophan/tyrosine transport system substrate-binding protein